MHLNFAHLPQSIKLIRAKNQLITNNHKRIAGFHKKRTNSQVAETTMKSIVLSQMPLKIINQQQTAF